MAADVSNQELLRVRYDSDLDVAEMFSVVLRNADNQFLDSALFDVGKTVEIHMGYGNDLRPMMLGEITALEPNFPENGPPTLTINGYDKSHRMRHNQPEPRSYRNVNDSAIAALIAVENGLIPMVDPSPIFHIQKPVLQSGSDMAFLKERALANFFEVRVWWDRLYFQFPRPQGEAYVLEWGRSLSSFSPRISASGLAGIQVVRGYSEELAQAIVAFAMAPDFNPANLKEKLGSAGLEFLLSLGRRATHGQKVESPVDALVLAKSLLQDVLEGMYEGSGACVGIPDLMAGRYVEVRGVGRRFSGTYRLRKVTHTIDENGYRLSFEVTQRSGANLLGLLRKTVNESPAPNRAEKFHGVIVAKVTSNVEAFDAPPAIPMGRVKVSYPTLSENVESGWARVVMPMAGKDMGMYFLPEVDDEVLVAFENGDLSSPVVLGGLYNSKRLPPATNSDTLNSIRVIKSKSGHTVTFDDSPAAPKVVIRHKGGSEISLAGDGSVSVKAMGDLTLQANGTLTLDATKVDVKVATVMNVGDKT